MCKECLEDEKKLLGSLIADRAAAGSIPMFNNKWFREWKHRVIWDALEDLYWDAGQFDLITIRDHLTSKNFLKRVGGVDYLVTLVELVHGSGDIGHYATKVHDNATNGCQYVEV